MTNYLLIDEGEKYNNGPYIEKYKLFTSIEECMKIAVGRGWKGEYGMGINIKPGVLNMYWEGTEIKISVIAVEVVKNDLFN